MIQSGIKRQEQLRNTYVYVIHPGVIAYAGTVRQRDNNKKKRK